MMNSIDIRPARAQDVEKIKELTDEMLTPTGLGRATVKKIHNLVVSQQTLFLTAWDNEQLVGYTCGVLHENIFNDRLRVTDIGVYVLPGHRGSQISRELIAGIETWARERGAEEIWLGQTTGGDPDRVIKYYNRLGYTTKGFNSVKEL